MRKKLMVEVSDVWRLRGISYLLSAALSRAKM